MENQRNFLTFGLLALCMVLYFKWMEFTAERKATNVAEVEQVSELPSTPTLEEQSTTADKPSGDLPSVPGAQLQATPTNLITVETDMVVAKINPVGGVIERVELKKEPVSLDEPDKGFPLFKNTAEEVYVAQDGLLSRHSAPSHQTAYKSENTAYNLGSSDQVVVPLSWVSDTGVEVVKTITFKKDSYVVEIDYAVNNKSSSVWSGAMYAQFNRTEPRDSGGGFGRLPSYTGAAIYTQESSDETYDKYKKIDFGDLEDLQAEVVDGERGLQLDTNTGWIAMLQHYFVGAWIPADGPKKFFSSVSGKGQKKYRIGYKQTNVTTISPQQTDHFNTKIFIGPKEQSRLKALEKVGITKLSKTVDYGWLTPIADPLFVALNWFHSLVGNWGWAIILLTIAIKILFYPLSAASYRSMGKMRKLQPRMQTLKERYKDDRQKFQMEMMALYKKEKVNPAGGCLPMLIQIPVFIALYWVLLESVEMRQAPFALWWQDLSAKDPYYVLPVLMGVSMYLMQKLNPAPMDDIQKKVFAIMPFALTFLFMTFPQGLVLYWVVNNILTMAQQWFNYKQQEKNA